MSCEFRPSELVEVELAPGPDGSLAELLRRLPTLLAPLASLYQFRYRPLSVLNAAELSNFLG